MDDEALARRARRATWPIQRLALSEASSDLVVTGTPSERIAMVHRLTMDAWAMAGLEIPDYPRSQAVGRYWRRSRE